MKTVIGVLTLSLSIFGCRGNPQPAASKQAETDAQTVEVLPVVSQKLATTFTLPAQLVPFQSVNVYPKVTGFVDMIRVDRGSRVHKGELIVRLSARNLWPNGGRRNPQCARRNRNCPRPRPSSLRTREPILHLTSAAKTPGVVAENDVMVASQTTSADEGQVQSAESNVEAAREALRSVAQLESYLNIYAPFDGIVTTRNLHEPWWVRRRVRQERCRLCRLWIWIICDSSCRFPKHT